MTISSNTIIQPSGSYGSNWPQSNNLPQGKEGSISSAGWTDGNEGFVQQTFLGASITSFDVNAGFGDTTSSLSVSVVNDEYNISDGLGLGLGDDVYHNGIRDIFRPPVVGSPVFFKFGKHTATVEQAYRLHFDQTYNIDSMPSVTPFNIVITNGPITSVPNGYYLISKTGSGASQVNTWRDESALANDLDHPLRGSGHFTFGGVLQSYTENKGPGGNPLYNISVQDPREILSNATLVLNNYAGTTNNNKNLFNVYGFLEYNPSQDLQDLLDLSASERVVLTRHVDDSVNPPKIFYRGKDEISGNIDDSDPPVYPNESDFYKFNKPTTYSGSTSSDLGSISERFPITGQGFSRRGDKGIPLYRIKQAVNALFEYDGALPYEYKEAGFGGEIDFRGYNYVVDFSGIPFDKIPALYYFDFDQIDLLSFVQELCDIISHDFFVSLLPVIDHPACSILYSKNQHYIDNNEPNKIIAGIIRIDTIDKSEQPQYGAIQSYLDNLQTRGIHVENQDLGFELSNVVTDKMLVGAQEVDMYYFNTERDRDFYQLALKNYGDTNYFPDLQKEQWKLETALQQQVLPFYGFIGDKCPTIPLGFGSYQQIKLDASSLDAYGVGRYYIATEMELRAAAVSYEAWRDFLLEYDEQYIREVGEHQAFLAGVAAVTGDTVDGINDPDVDEFDEIRDLKNREFGVSVPRCVHVSDLNGVRQLKKDGKVIGEYPLSPCAPPFGFPLYYKRAESIGIPQAGLVDVGSSITSIITNIEKIQNSVDDQRDFLALNLKNLRGAIQELEKKVRHASGEDQKKLKKLIEQANEDITKRQRFIDTAGPGAVSAATSTLDDNKKIVKMMPRLARQYEKNAKKVYNFVKNVADKHLGKTFLVRIPKMTNVAWTADTVGVSVGGFAIYPRGPFAFPPRTTDSSNDNLEFAHPRKSIVEGELRNRVDEHRIKAGKFHHYLNIDPVISGDALYNITDGALKCNFNPVSQSWDFNYLPEPQGGYFSESTWEKLNQVGNPQNDGSRVVAPLWGTFIDKDSRISCYVRYDNSQYLDFGGVGSDDIVQINVEGSAHFPDIMEELDNLNPDQADSFDKIQDRIASDKDQDHSKAAKHIAFLKCEIDANFYMIPKTKDIKVSVFADTFDFKPNFSSLGVVEGVDDEGCPTKTLAREYSKPIFYPKSTLGCGGCSTLKTFDYDDTESFVPPGFSNASQGTEYTKRSYTLTSNTVWDKCDLDSENRHIIKTDRPEDYDPNFVYAIVTLPVRVNPSVDSRYVDGPMMQFNAPKIKNILTADVTHHPDFIHCPGDMNNDVTAIDCSKITFDTITNALSAQKSIFQKVSLALPEGALTYSSPSPVYPNLFALPLMSKERCYGPWFSSVDSQGYSNLKTLGHSLPSRTRYSNIGGKIEFEKDESLAPWGYNGYELMNESADLKTQFSNSLLLFNERGGFSIPEAPTGISLCKALQQSGPLVTSISVNIGDSIKTSVKMDIYTARFGKLQKQKEIEVGKIVREKQRLKDEKNRNIRLGLRDEAIGKKSLTISDNTKFNNIINTASETADTASSLERKQTSYDAFVGSVSRNSVDATDLDGNKVKQVSWTSQTSIQSSDHLHDAISAIPDARILDAKRKSTFAGLPINGIDQTPGSNYYMPSPQNVNTFSRYEEFFGVNFDQNTEESGDGS